MDRKKLIRHLIYLIFFILVVNFVANKLYWYSSIWYFDMIMHFLGGLWIGLVSLYLLPRQNISSSLLLKVLLLVLCVGIGWEVYEVLVNAVIAKNSFNYLDTFSDIFFDLSGGAVAVFYFFKRIMIEQGSDVQ